MASPDERAGLIDRICGQNTALRHDIESLLPYYESADGVEPRRVGGTTLGLRSITHLALEGGKLSEQDDGDNWPEPPFSIGFYRVVGKLGEGGMGMVYRAVHPTLHCSVAIKVVGRDLFSEEDYWRFAAEMEIHRQLRHPGIARMIHSGEFEWLDEREAPRAAHTRPYIVVEYIDGETLTKHANERGLDAWSRLKLLLPVCEAVDHAHRRGIVHCDLKPDNILVDSAGNPKVLDFGIARMPDFQSTRLSKDRQRFIGSRAYASPEQQTGHNERVTPRSDVYALAIVAYELFSGERPERCKGLVVLNKRTFLANASDTHDRDFRHEVFEVLAAALRLRRGLSFATAGAFGEALDKILRSGGERGHDTKKKDSADTRTIAGALQAVLRTRINFGLRFRH